MSEKYIPNILTPQEKKKLSLDALFGFLGINESLEDQREVDFSLRILRQEIERTPSVGRILEQNKAHRSEFVIPVISHDQKERIIKHLGTIGVFPWEEDGLLVIDRRQDLEILRLAGLVKGTRYKEEKPVIEVTPGPDIEEKMYQFPLPDPAPKEVRPSSRRKEETQKKDVGEEIESGIDTELAEIIQKWDAGIIEEDDEEFKMTFGEMPTLTLFPRKYIWNGKNHIHVRTGEVITSEKELNLIEKAKEGDSKATDTVVRLNVGFVIYLAKRVRDRFGGDIDEIFQYGLLGLEYAIRNYRQEEDVKFTSYAGKCIEGYMRKGLKVTRSIITMNHKSLNELRKVRTKEDKKQQLLGPEYDEDEENRMYSDNLARLETRLLIGAKFDPIESHLNDESAPEIDMLGQDTADSGNQEEALDIRNLKKLVTERLATLTPREEKVIRLRFGLAEMSQVVIPGLEPGERASSFNSEGLTLEEVGVIMGVTKERIREIEAKALRKLKHPSRSRVLRRFVERNFDPEGDDRLERDIDMEVHARLKTERDRQAEIEANSKIRFRSNRVVREETPFSNEQLEGWLSLRELAMGFKLTPEEIQERVARFKEKYPKYYKSLGDIKDGKPYIKEYFFENLIPLIERSFREPEEENLEAKGAWKKASDLAKELNMEEVDLKLLALNYRSSNPEWFRTDTDIHGEEFNEALIEELRNKIEERK